MSEHTEAKQTTQKDQIVTETSQSDLEKIRSKQESGTTKSRRKGRSLLAPVALIGVGAVFLLSNLGLIAQPHWSYLLGFWPLLLIFIGLDILVTQLRAPTGTFLSLLVSLAAVSVFGYLLVSGPTNAAARSLGIPTTSQSLQEHPLSVTTGDAASAVVELELGNLPVTVSDTPQDDLLVGGTIWSANDLSLDVESEDRILSVSVSEDSDLVNLLNPWAWSTNPGDHEWQINLNRRLPLDLEIDSGNGAATLELDELSLSRLRIDGGNGSIMATLPEGSYEGRIESGNGALRISLPDDGRQNLRVDSGNGSISLTLPDDVPARIEFDTGNGSVSVDDRFNRVSGDSEEGAYETADYSEDDGILLRVETGNGSIQVGQP